MDKRSYSQKIVKENDRMSKERTFNIKIVRYNERMDKISYSKKIVKENDRMPKIVWDKDRTV